MRKILAPAIGLVAALVPSAALAATPPVDAVLVSQTADGGQGDSNSNSPAITPDGRFVVFGSNATNLVPGDTNGVYDLFVRDLQTGSLTLVSAGLDGAAANGASYEGRISDDGRFVAFYSGATNLVADDTDGVTDVFVRDLQEGTTTRVAPGAAQSLFPDISGNGRYVTFTTLNQLVTADTSAYTDDIYLWDRTTGEVELLTPGTTESINAAISADGRWVAMSAELTGTYGIKNNIYLLDRTTGDLSLISKAADGSPLAAGAHTPSVSDDGRFVSYGSNSQVYLADTETGTITLVSAAPDGTPANDFTFPGEISPDGRYVAYFATANNLTDTPLPAGYDAYTYLYDRESGTNALVSITPAGITNGWSAAVSAGGEYVAYETDNDVVEGDANGHGDVYRTQLS